MNIHFTDRPIPCEKNLPRGSGLVIALLLVLPFWCLLAWWLWF